MELLESDPAVKAVRNIKGEIIEPGKMRFKVFYTLISSSVVEYFIHWVAL